MSDDPEVKINEQQEEVVEYQEQTDSNNIDLTIKHPLQNSWTMWYDHGCKKGVAWGDHLHEIFTFSSVEDFWRLVIKKYFHKSLQIFFIKILSKPKFNKKIHKFKLHKNNYENKLIIINFFQ